MKVKMPSVLCREMNSVGWQMLFMSVQLGELVTCKARQGEDRVSGELLSLQRDLWQLGNISDRSRTLGTFRRRQREPRQRVTHLQPPDGHQAELAALPGVRVVVGQRNTWGERQRKPAWLIHKNLPISEVKHTQVLTSMHLSTLFCNSGSFPIKEFGKLSCQPCIFFARRIKHL